jgi:hypothetical protein
MTLEHMIHACLMSLMSVESSSQVQEGLRVYCTQPQEGVVMSDDGGTDLLDNGSFCVSCLDTDDRVVSWG